MPFQLESNYKPRGDQGQAIAKLIKSVESRQSPSDAARRHRFGQDFHHRQRDPGIGPADARHFAQQNAGGAALLRVQTILSAATQSNISSATSITTSRKLTSRAPTPTSRRIRRSTRRSSGCGFRRPARCFRAATPSWSRASPAFTALRRRKITNRCCSP